MAGEFEEQRDAFGDIKVSVRLSDEQATTMLAWARQRVVRQPALYGRFFRADDRPKMGTILREAALDHTEQETRR